MRKLKIRYALPYEIRPEGFTTEEKADQQGLADALIIISIYENKDGSRSQEEFSLHGDNRGLDDVERFKAWSMMGLSIADRQNLEGWKKDFMNDFAVTLRTFFKNGYR